VQVAGYIYNATDGLCIAYRVDTCYLALSLKYLIENAGLFVGKIGSRTTGHRGFFKEFRIEQICPYFRYGKF